MYKRTISALLVICLLLSFVPPLPAYAEEILPESIVVPDMPIVPDGNTGLILPDAGTAPPAGCTHAYVDAVTAPGCASQGYTTHTCSLCMESYVDGYTEPTGHAWNEGEVTLAPTETTTGVKTYTCTVCLTTKQEELPATGPVNTPEPTPEQTECAHSGGAATCLAQAQCTLCFEFYGELGGHSFGGGVCSLCGAADPNYIAPVKVIFNCTPTETLVWVADELDNEYQPEADGSFLLLPGSYYYVAFCEGYVGIESSLIVEENTGTLSVDVVLEKSMEEAYFPAIYSAESANKDVVKGKLEDLQKQEGYKPGENGGQCMEFAGKVFREIFGGVCAVVYYGHEPASDRNTYLVGRLCDDSISYSAGSESYTDATKAKTSFGTITVNSFKSLVINALPGDILQVLYLYTDGSMSPHTMVIKEVTDSGFEVYHSNYVGGEIISVNTKTWNDVLYMYNTSEKTLKSYAAVSLYRARNYVDIGSDEPSTPSNACGDNATWTLSGDTLTISGSGAIYDYSTENTPPWYDNRSSIKKVVVSSGITTVGSCAFAWCDNLTEITLPSSVTSIKSGALSYNTKLTSIAIPGSISSIESGVFYGSGLTSITIPASISSIDTLAFAFCSSLTEIRFDHANTDTLSIGTDAFSAETAIATTLKVKDSSNVHTAISGYNWTGSNRNVSIGISGPTFPLAGNVSGMTILTYGSPDYNYSYNTSKARLDQYGTDWYGSHHGTEYFAIDISGNGATLGTEVKAVEAGTVVYHRPTYGQIIIQHTAPLVLTDGSTVYNTWYSTYVHMQNITVSEGSTVNRGQVIGEVGAQGTNAIHLHFSLSTKLYQNKTFHYYDSHGALPSGSTDAYNTIMSYAYASLNPNWVFPGVSIMPGSLDNDAMDKEAMGRFSLGTGYAPGNSQNGTQYNNGVVDKETYTLSFDANGGSGSMSPMTAMSGYSFTIPECGFTKSGYELRGWSLKRDDGAWMASNGQFVDEQTANTLGLRCFYSEADYTFEESWANSGSNSYTFYASWKQILTENVIEEDLRKALASGETSIVLEGSITLDSDLTIPQGTELILSFGKLTVPEGVKIVNNGEIVIGDFNEKQKGILSINGTLENNGTISVVEGDLKNYGATTNNGTIETVCQLVGNKWAATIINYSAATMVNNGSISIKTNVGDEYLACSRMYNYGTFTQSDNADFYQEGYVEGIAAEYISIYLTPEGEKDITNALNAGYRSITMDVSENLTLTQNMTIPANVNFRFGNWNSEIVFTIPAGIKLTVESEPFFDLATDETKAKIVVEGTLVCKSSPYLGINGTINVSGELITEKGMTLLGEMNVLDGGTYTNHGSVTSYGTPSKVNLSNGATLNNYGYIAGINEQSNSDRVLLNGVEYSYYGTSTMTEAIAAECLSGVFDFEEDDISVIWQAGVDITNESEASISVKDYYDVWFIFGPSDQSWSVDGWGLAGISYSPEKRFSEFNSSRIYAVVVKNDPVVLPLEKTVYSIEEFEQGIAEDYPNVRLSVETSLRFEKDYTIPENVTVEFANIEGTATIASGCTLTNKGTVTVNESYMIASEEGSVIDNQGEIYLYGYYDIQGDYTGNMPIFALVDLTLQVNSWNGLNDSEVYLYAGTMDYNEIIADMMSETPRAYSYAGTVGAVTAVPDSATYNQSFSFNDLEAGEYIIMFYKPGCYVIKGYILSLWDDFDMGVVNLWLCGDVNNDGSVDSYDALQIQRYFVRLPSVFDTGGEMDQNDRLLAANVSFAADGDNVIDSYDALQVQRHFVGLSSVFSAIK